MGAVICFNRGKAFLSLVFALFFPLTGVAQTAGYQYVLNGYLGIEGGESFNYQLLLNDSVNGYLQGVAYTWSAPGKRVTARVVGRRYPGRQTLHIQETTILANDGFQSKAVICLINATLSIDTANGSLRGPIITQTAENGATCSKGSISLIRPAEIAAVFQAGHEALTPAGSPMQQPAPAIADSRPPQPLPPQRKGRPAATRTDHRPAAAGGGTAPLVKEVTAGKPQEFLWNSDKIILKIWDDKDPDDDRVSILLNDRPVLENHILTAEKKTLVVDLDDKALNMLIITALNNGGMPPNTAYILLLDGEKEHAVIAHNTPGKQAVIRIKRQK